MTTTGQRPGEVIDIINVLLWSVADAVYLLINIKQQWILFR